VRRFPYLLLLGLFALLRPVSVLAASTVGTGTPGSCTEAALNTALADALASGGTITFNCGASPHTITLTSTKLINKSITIDGGGLITLSGGGTTTLLEIRGFNTLLTLKNLTLADGFGDSSASNPCSGNACGGAVRGQYRASLTVINCIFKNNQTAGSTTSFDFGGGAIFLHTGMFISQNSQFLNNHADNGSGGAVHLLHTDALIEDSVFDGNTSNEYGAALYNDGTRNDDKNYAATDGLLQFNRNVFSNNVSKGQGGAVFNFLYLNRRPNVLVVYDTNVFSNNRLDPDAKGDSLGGALRIGNGPARILNTLFVNNTAAEQGGALWTGERGKVDIVNSTFTGNKAVDGGGTAGLGGAIAINSAGATLTNVTIANNQAGFQSGGLRSKSNNITLKNTLIANNTANPTQPQNCNITFSGSANLQSPLLNDRDRPCAAGITLANPGLAALASNGGFSQTLALLTSSPAIDAGDNSVCPVFDQRGKLRNIDGDGSGTPDCDIGAYEYRAFDKPAVSGGAPMINRVQGLSVTLTWSPITWAQGYSLEIASRASFPSEAVVYANPALGGGQAAASVTLPDYGTYYWHVRVRKPDGSWGDWAPMSILVAMP
jgi:predicted outer membrane repeat protein